MTPGAVRDPFILISCEHGGNRTPPPFDRIFAGHRRLLSTHRGYDPGALEMGRALASALKAPYVSTTVSRLVVEMNRPARHPAFYSTVMRKAPEAMRTLALERYFKPYRGRIEALIDDAIADGRTVFHVGSHSFTPVKDGETRRADIGLLYDPKRPLERAFCRHWQAVLARFVPDWTVRLNYPYFGYSAGLTTDLRRRHGPDAYVGIELEINQKRVRAGGAVWARTRSIVAASAVAAFASFDAGESSSGPVPRPMTRSGSVSSRRSRPARGAAARSAAL